MVAVDGVGGKRDEQQRQVGEPLAALH